MATTGFELACMWSEAPALLPHSAGCACAGHAGLHLDPAAVEADMLDYLAAHYKAEGLGELSRLIEARQGSQGKTFSTWLMGLDTEPLTAQARARLIRDLGTTLSSLATARG